jgi:two-component system phosphate regulon sensor histidine kinase PhoR
MGSVRRRTAWLFGFVACTPMAFGWVADHTLREKARRAQGEAEAIAAETARLAAQSLAAALGKIEQGVLARRAEPGVVTERLALPPRPSVPEPGAVPYGRLERSALAKLLSSTRSSPSGIAEAVLARIALGDATRVTASGEAAPPDVAEQLLSGTLPVHPDDLAFLARSLGVGSDPRVASLRQKLLGAPSGAELPEAPLFRRTRRGPFLDGWTVTNAERVHYSVTFAVVVAAARLPGGVTVGDPGPRPSDSVSFDAPDLPARSSVVVPMRTADVFRTNALRLALWLAVIGSVALILLAFRALAAEARATAREKRFLASVTHELRTPLAALRLFGERLAQGRGEPREYGTLIAEESERLETLVERVLAATRASERPSFAPVEPGELLRSALALVAPRAERRDVVLTSRSAEGLPTVLWDAEAVRRALLNLLDNAIRHGREGGRVEAAAFVNADAVCLSVTDDGPGIGRRERSGLFARFARGRTDAPGTGLGLHFAEQVAHAHGGRVDLESEEGHGCVFTLRLPVRPPGMAMSGSAPS